MGRSNPNERIENPVEFYISYEAEFTKGHLSVYDKETKKNNPLAIENRWVILDQNHFRVTGYDSRENKGMGSNIARNTKKDKLMVRYQGDRDPFLYGTWEEIGERAKGKGGKWTKLVYCMDTEAYKICCIELRGESIRAFDAALTAAGLKTSDLEKYPVVFGLQGTKDEKAGNTPYKAPVFYFKKVDTSKPKGEELDRVSIEKDEVLQLYLKQALSFRQEENEEEQEGDNATPAPVTTQPQVRSAAPQIMTPAQQLATFPAAVQEDDLPF